MGWTTEKGCFRNRPSACSEAYPGTGIGHRSAAATLVNSYALSQEEFRHELALFDAQTLGASATPGDASAGPQTPKP